MKHFKVFGYIVYAYVQKKIEINLMKKVKKYIFIDHSEELIGYHLYNPKSKQLIISWDVIFDKMMTWQWSTNKVISPQLFEDREKIHVKS